MAKEVGKMPIVVKISPGFKVYKYGADQSGYQVREAQAHDVVVEDRSEKVM